MFDLLWMIPALPLAGFLCLALAGSRFSRRGVAIVGTGSVGLSAAVAGMVAGRFWGAPPPEGGVTQHLWTWMSVGGFRPEVALYLDALSLVMALVVTGVGFLIHLYACEFMEADEGYSRFFAYMNLFVGSMLILLLADNLLLLYLGWEGVGACSYLLIGFWYRDPANGRAARKAFVVTRVGDTAMAVGLFLLVSQLGTLQIREVLERAPQLWVVGEAGVLLVAALMLGGAVGKSAQVPLQVWLPDAMAGPTPVSALIHAATMVTAGVYLIARLHVLFILAPAVQAAVAVIGAVTLLLAACSALVQEDIKRVLAYSTISQIGYMFLALGAGAWSAAIFHFMTHAFFKALLFLGAGAVILAQHHEHNMFRMGGLRRELPVTFWTFLIGSAALASLPLVTAGFYSKDLILEQVWHSEAGGAWLWTAGIAGALLTAIYSFRMVFLTFFGKVKTEVGQRAGFRIRAPLVVLAGFSILSGFLEMPHWLGGAHVFTGFLGTALPQGAVGAGGLLLQLAAALVPLAGLALAYELFLRRSQDTANLAGGASTLRRFWFAGWGFDRVYDTLLVRPFVWAARVNRDDFFDLFSHGTARLLQGLHRVCSRTQTGGVRWYAMGIAAGAVVVLAFAVGL